MNNGISSKATEKEQIKSDFECLIRGMNSTGMIDCIAYDDLFDEAMPMFDQMYELGKKEATTWHPYPEEKPPKTGDYLVTWLSLHTYRFPWVTIREFNAITNKFDYEDGRYYIALAWAELPEPYKQEADK